MIVPVAVLLLSGCGNDDSVPASPTPRNTAADVVETLPLVEWYPTPKHQHQPQYAMPSTAPSQDWQPQVTSRPVQPQPVWGGGYVQFVPQPWVAPAVPFNGYGTAVPAQGALYAPVPVWGQNAQPAPPVQRQRYPLVPQYGYVQRPWGAADGAENSSRAGQSINTWQMTNDLPAWGVPSSGAYPVQNPGLYNPRQGVVQPGYYW